MSSIGPEMQEELLFGVSVQRLPDMPKGYEEFGIWTIFWWSIRKNFDFGFLVECWDEFWKSALIFSTVFGGKFGRVFGRVLVVYLDEFWWNTWFYTSLTITENWCVWLLVVRSDNLWTMCRICSKFAQT